MNRTTALALGLVGVFALTVVVLLTVMPGPHKATDYLVIGAVARRSACCCCSWR